VVEQSLGNLAVGLVEPRQGGEATGGIVDEELLVDQVHQVLGR